MAGTGVTVRDLEIGKLYRLERARGWIKIKRIYKKEDPKNPHSKKVDCAVCSYLEREDGKIIYDALYEVLQIRKDLDKVRAKYYKDETDTEKIVSWKEKTSRKLLSQLQAYTKDGFSVLIYKGKPWSWSIETTPSRKRLLVCERARVDSNSIYSTRNEFEISIPELVFDYKDLNLFEIEEGLDFIIEDWDEILSEIKVSNLSKLKK